MIQELGSVYPVRNNWLLIVRKNGAPIFTPVAWAQDCGLKKGTLMTSKIEEELK